MLPDQRSRHAALGLVAFGAVPLLILSASACSDDGSQTPTEIEPQAEISGSMEGTTNFARKPAKGAPGEISRQKAWQLAQVWITTFAPRLEETWEQERGAEIDWPDLQRCGPTPYVASPFEAPPSDVPLSVSRGEGPWWLVNFCAAGELQMNVAVSAWNSDLEIVDGELRFPDRAGNHFVPEPIPPNTKFKDARLVSPARAKTLAREVTGQRPAGRPELVKRPNVKPQFAHWRIRLPSSARLKLKSENRIVERQEVFVGSHRPLAPGAVYVDDGSGPRSMEVGYYRNAGSREAVPLHARPGYPLAKHEVSGIAENGGRGEN